MPLNTILANSETVAITDHKFVGQVISRNQRISSAEILSVQPFFFQMKPNSYMLLSQNKKLLSELRVADKVNEQYLNFGSTGWLNYIKYQGDLTQADIENCLWQTSSSGRTLVLGNFVTGSLAPPSTAYVVKAGDYCQVGRYSYIATADVLRGTGSTVSIPVHRTLLSSVTSTISAVIGQYGTTVDMGGSTYTGITFPVLLKEYPNYALVPMTNDSFIAWSGTFDAFENVLNFS